MGKAAFAIRRRSETLILESPAGPVEVQREQWRTTARRWVWTWSARRVGREGWQTARSARKAIASATYVRDGKRPRWLAEAAARAERELRS